MISSQSRLFDISLKNILQRCIVKTVLAVALALPMLTYVADAAPFQTLANFAIEHDAYNNRTGEDDPVGRIVRTSDGAIYIAFQASADLEVPNEYGRIVKVVNGQQTSIHTFGDLAGGAAPGAGLTLGSDGSFYGTTTTGGSGGVGTVYKLTPSGQFSVVHSFNGYNGDRPDTELVQGPDGSFYGTCEFGGSSRAEPNYDGAGVIYKIDSTGSFTVLHNFQYGNPNDGQRPFQGLSLGKDGSLYGTTNYAGTHNRGIIYKITTTGQFTILYNFNDADTSGFGPSSALTQAQDGNFYGTCTVGGTVDSQGNSYGLIYRVTPTGQYTVVHPFNVTDGLLPYGSLVLKAGYLYGTTEGGGTPESNKPAGGTIYRIDTNGNFSTLHTFHTGDASGTTSYFTEGDSPIAPMILGSDGNLYGITSRGGSGRNGNGSGAEQPYDLGGTLFVQPLPRKTAIQ